MAVNPRELSSVVCPVLALSSTRTRLRLLQPAPPPSPSPPPPPPPPARQQERRENIYTLPNALTLARICACPAIGYYVLQGELGTATGLLFVAGVSDLVRAVPPLLVGRLLLVGTHLLPPSSRPRSTAGLHGNTTWEPCWEVSSIQQQTSS